MLHSYHYPDPTSQNPRIRGKLADVQTRHELMLTRRRAVDLCRLGGCCCTCC
ncbi:putative leader peptide [Rhodococcus sp. JT-3]|uniref:putative leader peptide n=1 Tax=Rhodococcus sp. JT-3 TaxID=1973213 RepID=UPI003FA3AD70